MLKIEVSINYSYEGNRRRNYFLKRKCKSQLNGVPQRYIYINFIYILKDLEKGYIALYQIVAENTPLFFNKI